MFFRRLARRGGIKRIAATIYNDIRMVLKDRLQKVSLSLLA
jgi:histone H4